MWVFGRPSYVYVYVYTTIMYNTVSREPSQIHGRPPAHTELLPKASDFGAARKLKRRELRDPRDHEAGPEPQTFQGSQIPENL